MFGELRQVTCGAWGRTACSCTTMAWSGAKWPRRRRVHSSASGAAGRTTSGRWERTDSSCATTAPRGDYSLRRPGATSLACGGGRPTTSTRWATPARSCTSTARRGVKSRRPVPDRICGAFGETTRAVWWQRGGMAPLYAVRRAAPGAPRLPRRRCWRFGDPAMDRSSRLARAGRSSSAPRPDGCNRKRHPPSHYTVCMARRPPRCTPSETPAPFFGSTARAGAASGARPARSSVRCGRPAHRTSSSWAIAARFSSLAEPAPGRPWLAGPPHFCGTCGDWHLTTSSPSATRGSCCGTMGPNGSRCRRQPANCCAACGVPAPGMSSRWARRGPSSATMASGGMPCRVRPPRRSATFGAPVLPTCMR